VSSDEYLKAGYGDIEIGYGSRPAVLAIDYQKSHTRPEFPFGGRPLALRALENTCRLLEAARSMNVPVALCYTAYQSVRDMPYWKIKSVREQYLPGNGAIELDDRIADATYDLIVRKTGPSMFYETKVQPFLTKARVDTVIITGVNTSGCVRATVIDSFQRGYRTVVPEECVGDVEEGPHRDNLRDIQRRYADVVDLKSVLEYLSTLGSLTGAR
jgi:maleamate amidohydrolase